MPPITPDWANGVQVSIRTRPFDRVMRVEADGHAKDQEVSIRTRPFDRVMPACMPCDFKSLSRFQSAPGLSTG